MLFPLKIIFNQSFKHADDDFVEFYLLILFFLSFYYKIMKRYHTILYSIRRTAILIFDAILNNFFQIICPLLLDNRSFNAKKIDNLWKIK